MNKLSWAVKAHSSLELAFLALINRLIAKYRQRLGKSALGTVAFLVFIFSGPAIATGVYYLPMENMIEESAVIVSGTVKEKRNIPSKLIPVETNTGGSVGVSGPFTVHTLEVQEVLKGKVDGELIDVWSLGGYTETLKRLNMSLVSYNIEEGQAVVFFLMVDAENNYYWAKNAVMGVYLRDDSKSGSLLVPFEDVEYLDKTKAAIPDLYLSDLRGMIH